MDSAEPRRAAATTASDKRAFLQNAFQINAGPLQQTLAVHTERAAAAARALWSYDASAWSRDPAVQQKISNRLGWLKSPELMAASVPRLRQFAHAVRSAGTTDVVLLGMGGSSLAPEVLRSIVGIRPGWPRFHMLDSTDPAAVRATETSPATTLYVLASKSGTTIEPNSLGDFFRERLVNAGIETWADHFVAITDEGTTLADRARNEKFRDLFINPSDIGGRYSALSYFGLVPAALMDQDIEAIVGWGLAMLETARQTDRQPMDNPAVGLGLTIGAAALAGRDKLTLLLPPALEPFGLWVEQLIAESTGKNGTGVVPIAGEPIARPETYGQDRMFVAMASGKESPANVEGFRSLPIVTLTLAEPEAIGAEFMRWEIATAVAGALLDINPFDEPNVQQAKDATTVLLKRYQSDGGRLPAGQPDATIDGVTLELTDAAKRLLNGKTLTLLTLLQAGDYVATLAYLGYDPSLANVLHDFRAAVRDRTGAATMFGYGPRYLHSTGQLHKGGPPSGVFVLITATPSQDVAIPGKPFTFGTLELAQALGDFSSLNTTGRRGLHVHLPSPDATLLESICARLLDGTNKS